MRVILLLEGLASSLWDGGISVFCSAYRFVVHMLIIPNSGVVHTDLDGVVSFYWSRHQIWSGPHGDKQHPTRGYSIKPSFGFNCQLRCLDPFSDYLLAVVPLTPGVILNI